MGHLVKLKFDSRGKEALLDSTLRSAPYFSRYDKKHGLYEFRAKEAGGPSDSTPDSSATIEPDGVLLNALGDYGVYEAVSKHLEERLRQEIGAFDTEF